MSMRNDESANERAVCRRLGCLCQHPFLENNFSRDGGPAVPTILIRLASTLARREHG
jgi:hypothetical protein